VSQDKGRLKLLATLTAKHHEEYVRSTSELHKDTQLVLRRFHEVRLLSGLSPGEAERAQHAFPHEPREKLAKGLGEYMIAARELVKRFEAAKETHPQGYALVHAAIDWRRAGILRPIRESVLQKLAARYVDFLDLPHVDLDAESFSSGLQWAREPIGHHVALLSKKGEDGLERRFEAFDYLVDFLDRQAAPIAQQAWDTILGLASPADAFMMGIAASRRKDRAGAKKAFHQGLLHEDPHIAAWGTFFLGTLYLEEGNTLEAERQYRATVGSQQLPPAALASIDLGALVQARGDLAEAEQLFRAAMDSQHPDAAALAMANLGNVLKDRGELAEAERFYRKAIASGHPDAAAFAMLNLGGLVQDRGDLAEAERLLHAAMDSQLPEIAAAAKNNLGKHFADRGDLAEAERLYQAAIDSQHPKATPMALKNLGQLLLNKGDLTGAERLFRAAIASKALDATPLASVSLGKILQDRGELAEAEQLYRAAIDSGKPEAAAFAMTNLAPLLQARGELDEAERLLRLAISAASSRVGARWPRQSASSVPRSPLGTLPLSR
jgi:tetratricopeptide (TPR) repeat protein